MSVAASGEAMKIAYLAQSTIPSATANSVHVMKMCAGFAANGHRPVLFAARDEHHEDERSDAFAYYALPPTFDLVRFPASVGARRILRLPALRRAVRAAAPELCYARDPVTLLVASVPAVPLILELHDLPKARSVGGKARRLAIEALSLSRRLVRVVCITQALAEDVCAQWPRLRRRVLVCPDGADAFQGDDSPLPADWRGRPGALQAVYVGQLYEGRGMPLLVELARRLPEIDFHIVGGDAGAVRAVAETASGTGNLHLYGHRAHGGLAHYFAAADLLLAPYQARVAVAGNRGDTSRYMSPLKIFEYMAAGKAIVCSDLPVLREVLTPGKEAMLVPPDDAAAWEQAIRQLAASEALRQELGARARRELESRYTWRKRAERVLAF